MDNIEEFSSAEALRLLQDPNDNCSTLSEQLQTIDPLAIAPPMALFETSPPNLENVFASQSGLSHSPPHRTDAAPLGRKRARFNADRRAAVAVVQRQGACLRCRVLKINVIDIITNHRALILSAQS